NVRSPVHKETELGEDRTEIAATSHLTMPEADWEQARLQQRVIARVVVHTPGEEPSSLLAVVQSGQLTLYRLDVVERVCEHPLGEMLAIGSSGPLFTSTTVC